MNTEAVIRLELPVTITIHVHHKVAWIHRDLKIRRVNREYYPCSKVKKQVWHRIESHISSRFFEVEVVHVRRDEARAVGRRALEWFGQLSSKAAFDERELPTVRNTRTDTYRL